MKITADNLWAHVEGTQAERDLLRLYLTVQVKNAEHSESYQSGHWDGTVKLFDGRRERFATGLVRMVVGYCREKGVTAQVVDARAPHHSTIHPNGAWLRPYQREAVDVMLRRGRGILMAPTGCVAGDTKIGVCRAGRSFKISIRDLEKKHHSMVPGSSHSCWDDAIPTMIRSRDEDGFIRIFKLKDVFKSGVKETFTVKTSSGREIRSTMDHRYLTGTGWKRLSEIRIGDEIYVERLPGGHQEAKTKHWYRLTSGIPAHPFAGRKGVKPGKGGFSVPFHRLVAEADANGMPVESFIDRIKSGKTAGLVFMDPKKLSVHHVDGDTHNNDLGNLEVVDRIEHSRIHGVQGNWRHVTSDTELDSIVSIEKFGEEETFDIEMDGEPHNFIANGVVVHNSGKSEIAAALTQAIPCRWLVLVDTRDLMHQMAERIALRTGEPAGLAGDGEWSPRRVTVATLQTLLQGIGQGGPVDRLLEGAQGLIADEVQVLAADEFRKVAMATPNAWWRFGISATPLEREDEADYRAIEALGPLIHEIPVETLFELGHLARPEILMVEFPQPKMTGSYPEIYEAGVVLSDARNALVARLAARGSSPRPTLVFFKSIYHGKVLAREIGKTAEVEVVSGVHGTNQRDSARRRLTRGHTEVLCTSLPYDEFILVRSQAQGTRVAAIGDIVENQLTKEPHEVWTRLADGSDGWGAISEGIKHPRNGAPIVETNLRGGARIITTSNHSLIRPDGSSGEPAAGESFCQAMDAPKASDPVKTIDVCAAIPNRDDFEVIVSGLTQAKVRMFKSELAFLEGKRFADPGTTSRVVARISSRSCAREELRSALMSLKAVKYHKEKFRAPVPSSASEYDWMKNLGLSGRITKWHGHGPYTLPLRLQVTDALSRLAGMFVAEGCTLEKPQKPGHAPLRTAIFAGLASVAPSEREGFKEKAKIRKTYSDALLSALGWIPRVTPQQLILNGSVPYVLFRHVLGVGGKSPTKRVPGFIWESGDNIREAFLFGYFLGDGHRGIRNGCQYICWTTISRELAIGAYYLLLGMGASASMTRETKLHGHGKHRKYTVATSTPLFGFQDHRSRKQQERRSDAIATYVRDENRNDEFVYDISVPGVERFYAGAGVLAHNSRIFNKGIDIPEARSGINAAGGASRIDALQKVGRGMRVVPGKTSFRYWDILDTGNYNLEDHARKRIEAYRSRNYNVRVVRQRELDAVLAQMENTP